MGGEVSESAVGWATRRAEALKMRYGVWRVAHAVGPHGATAWAKLRAASRNNLRRTRQFCPPYGRCQMLPGIRPGGVVAIIERRLTLADQRLVGGKRAAALVELGLGGGDQCGIGQQLRPRPREGLCRHHHPLPAA